MPYHQVASSKMTENEAKVNFIYDESLGKANDEDYLLGKAVDKDFDRRGTEGQINAVEYDCTPESIFASRAAHQVDLQRKLSEDPLIAVKMREVDTRKKILDNPLKMKQINKYIEKMKRKKEKKKKKKSKKKKGKRGSDDSDSDVDVDAKLLEKLRKKLADDDAGSSSEEEKPKRQKSERSPERKQQDRLLSLAGCPRQSPDRRRQSRSPKRKDRSPRRQDRSPKRHDRSPKRHDRSPKRHVRSPKHNDRSPRRKDKSPKRQDRSPKRHDRSPKRKDRSPKRQSPDRNRRDRQRSPDARRKSPNRRRSPDPKRRPDPKKSVDGAAEKARKLQEMMENAKWRDTQRETKVKKYREESEREEAEYKGRGADQGGEAFVRNTLLKAAVDSSSVEKRIQSNKHNIQRGHGSMTENFVKR